MPFYDLKCIKCSNEFNKKASMDERSNKLIKCPECGSNELEAVFNNINIVHKKTSGMGECPNVHKCGGCCNH